MKDSTALADIHDRVAEAYYGKMGQSFMEETQERIHWICENVLGEHILDVGCSQGIVPILLAREGCNIVGVDTSDKAIKEAKSYLSNEPKHVQTRVSYLNSDFLACDFNGKLFDTIILSEILEHLVKPELFIETAATMLKPKGRVIITVPFGINAFIDHKHTFYLLEPLRMILEFFSVAEIEFMGGWVGIVANKKDKKGKTGLRLNEVELGKLESAFYSIEKKLRNELAQRLSQLDDANKKYRVTTEQISILKSEIAEKTRIADESNKKWQLLNDAIKEDRKRFNEELCLLKNERNDKAEALHTAEKQLIRLEAELDSIRERLTDSNNKYRLSTEQVANHKEQLVALESHRGTTELALSEARAQLQDLENRLAQDRQESLDEISRLKNERDVKAEALHAAEKQLIRLETELESIRERLTDSNNKYRLSTEQVANHKEQLVALESHRGTTELALSEARAQLQDLENRLAQDRQESLDEISRLKNERDVKAEALHAAEKQLIRLETELESIRERLTDSNNKYRLSTEQVANLKEQLSIQQSHRGTAEVALSEAQIQVQELENRIEKASQEFLDEISEQNNKHNIKDEALSAAEEQIAFLESELEDSRVQLDDYNNKLLISLDEITGLTEQLKFKDSDKAILESALGAANERVQELYHQINEMEREQESSLKEISSLSILTEEKESELVNKYKELSDISLELKDVRESLQNQRLLHEEETREIHEKLDGANKKYRIVTGEEVPLLKAQLEKHVVASRDLHKKLMQLKREYAQEKRLRETAEEQVAKSRSTLSFRLGYILIHSSKSIRNLIRLPIDLWGLRKVAVARKALRKERIVNERKLEKLLSNNVPSKVSLQGDVVNKNIPSLQIAGSLADTKVACIMDDFTFHSYNSECVLKQLTPEDWSNELEGFQPDLLFIESAWRGKDEKWGNKVGHASQEVQNIVAWCNRNEVPTIFWNKEDPVHFETFLNTAKMFDYVFTTDVDCIHRYKTSLGHERVYLLPFAAQPKIHNPIEKYERKDAFCFAGAYYVRYPERTRDLESFITELPDFKALEIYDRNYGKDDPNYQFPSEYAPYIVGTLPFEQIDKAYKGYKYAINLNSIKQSQTMFARRVYELLASNTITVSNFSRGLRLLFGDLVVSTDNGGEVIRLLQNISDSDVRLRKIRLAGLRKILTEHTYEHRLSYIASKTSGATISPKMPKIVVLAMAKSADELKDIVACFSHQSYSNAELKVVLNGSFKNTSNSQENISYISKKSAKRIHVEDLTEGMDFVAFMVANDYYGQNYLTDIALATKYSPASIVGKGAYYSLDAGKCILHNEELAYKGVAKIQARCAAIRPQTINHYILLDWLSELPDKVLELSDGLAVDEFNYCYNGNSSGDIAEVSNTVDDIQNLNMGLSLGELIERSEQIEPEEKQGDEGKVVTGAEFSKNFSNEPSRAIQLTINNNNWNVVSSLADEKHEYLYGTVDHAPADLGFVDKIKLFADVTPGLNIQVVVFFLDAQKQRISNAILHANRNQETDIPVGTTWLRFGLRFYASGEASINAVVFGHRNIQPPEMMGNDKYLVVTNHYPSYDDLYRNGFVHSRVRSYKEHGVNASVFRFRENEQVTYQEFEDIDVVTGGGEALEKILSSGSVKHVLVHFMDASMWKIISKYIDDIKVTIWIHGSDIQSFERREFLFTDENERKKQLEVSNNRLSFWKEVFEHIHDNVHIVFVSKYLAETAMEDIGVTLGHKKYSIIHNPINNNLFKYHEKPIEQRKKILSIRPFSSKIYANDLTAKTIIALSKKTYFNDLEFRIIGDGKLFDETVEPIRCFDNVFIEKRFLTQNEIANIHKEYGVFLCPTRMDSQGVSRDEAMSSGLVPITNKVAAVPEFVSSHSGFLSEPESIDGIIDAIEKMYYEPELFSSMSENASKEIIDTRSNSMIIDSEFKLLK